MGTLINNYWTTTVKATQYNKYKKVLNNLTYNIK